MITKFSLNRLPHGAKTGNPNNFGNKCNMSLCVIYMIEKNIVHHFNFNKSKTPHCIGYYRITPFGLK